VIRNLPRIYRHGPRATGELGIELATRGDALAILENLAQRFADRLDPEILGAIGRDEFLGAALRVVGAE
jgi:hypothetical protein